MDMEESTTTTTLKISPKVEDKDTTITLSSSPLSSPTHEFSFTITLHPSPNSSPNIATTNHNNNNNKKSMSTSKYLDLAPADDIFYRGHLLPLQLVSRHSVDTIHVQDLTFPAAVDPATTNHEEQQYYYDQKRTKKSSFDFRWLLKKYSRFMEIISPSSSTSSKGPGVKEGQKYCDSSSSSKEEKGYNWMRRTRRRRSGLFSAPASRWTSPSNSGLLAAMPAGVVSTSSSSSEQSSMEELQSAIQAAIAHCKNSSTIR